MKIRQDFVTNSSSTSYIIAMKDEFNEENFFKALKIPKNFVFSKMIRQLFNIIDNSKESINEVIKDKRYNDYETAEDYIEDKYNNETVRKLKKLLMNNWMVYVGQFGDGGMGSGYLETYFCYSSILIDNDNIYLSSECDSY